MTDKNPKRAIELAELETDLIQLQSQAVAISGAIQYVKQKINALIKQADGAKQEP